MLNYCLVSRHWKVSSPWTDPSLRASELTPCLTSAPSTGPLAGQAVRDGRPVVVLMVIGAGPALPQRECVDVPHDDPGAAQAGRARRDTRLNGVDATAGIVDYLHLLGNLKRVEDLAWGQRLAPDAASAQTAPCARRGRGRQRRVRGRQPARRAAKPRAPDHLGASRRPAAAAAPLAAACEPQDPRPRQPVARWPERVSGRRRPAGRHRLLRTLRRLVDEIIAICERDPERFPALDAIGFAFTDGQTAEPEARFTFTQERYTCSGPIIALARRLEAAGFWFVDEDGLSWPDGTRFCFSFAPAPLKLWWRGASTSACRRPRLCSACWTQTPS